MTKLSNICWLLLLLPLMGCDKNNISDLQADTFVKYYNTFPVLSGADVKQVNGKGYALLGTAETFTSGTQICLIRTDEFGNMIGDSARYYGRSADDRAYCLKVMDDGGFAMLGSSKNPVTDLLEAYFIRTNSIGDTLWTRTIGRTNNLEGLYFIVGNDGSFIITGYVERGTGIIDKQIWLFALDADGNNLWPSFRTFGGDKDDEGRHLDILPDGKLAITGVTKSYPAGTPVSHAFLLITNSIGGTVAFFPIASTADEEGNCIRVIEDGSYLILGTTNNVSSGTGKDVFLKNVELLPGDLQANWEQTFESSGNDSGNRLLLEGNMIYSLCTRADAGNNTHISVIITGLNGNNSKFSNYGQGTQLTGNAFEKTADNGFIIIGTNRHTQNDISLALFKTNSDTSL
jgi:hypothetical protein